MRLFTALLHELGLLGECTRGKSIFPFQFALIITLAVIGRCIISDGIAGALFVVVSNIALNRVFESITRPALFKLEVDEEFFFNPAIQRFVRSLFGASE